jgi:DNA-binding NtrC family response regulator
MTESRILIVDDEPEMLENLDRLLTAEGHRCWTLSDSRAFAETLTEVKPDVLITDLRMPGVDGMQILGMAQGADPSLPIVLITAYASVASAVNAIQQGAFDYLAKPFSADQLCIVVERALRFRKLVVENENLRDQLTGGHESTIVGSSPPFVRLLDQVRRVATSDANVLITGESGTGKELIARSIHRQSGRQDSPFIPVDCAALPEGLLESELFGHEKGAFTGAVAQRKGLLLEANGGTLFLDEVAELTLPLQAKLLRVLEEREVRPVGGSKLVPIDVRILAATNRDLEIAVTEHEFRSDLFYRLNVVHLTLPPLRSRTGDVVLLVQRFLNDFSRANGKAPPTVSADVWDRLDAFDWPGNVRQLKNLVEQIVALDADGRVTISDLPPQIRFQDRRDDRQDEGGAPTEIPVNYAEAREAAMQAFRANYLKELLDSHNGNVSKAARAAGVSRRTIHRWVAETESWNGEVPLDDSDD